MAALPAFSRRDLDTLIVGEDGGVLRIELNRPHRANSINSTMIRELFEVLTQTSDRDDIGVGDDVSGPVDVLLFVD